VTFGKFGVCIPIHNQIVHIPVSKVRGVMYR
jgi:hypothetical protein